jgi:hypothetical protein
MGLKQTKIKWVKYWWCTTSVALAGQYSVQIQLLQLSTATGTILKAQKQKFGNNRQLCSCPSTALCLVQWTYQPHLMYMYSGDHLTYQPYTAAVNMTWSLLLASSQNGHTVLYLFGRHTVSDEHIHSCSHGGYSWNIQKMFGGTCAVRPLSPACHVNPMPVTSRYSKICDIWHL